MWGRTVIHQTGQFQCCHNAFRGKFLGRVNSKTQTFRLKKSTFSAITSSSVNSKNPFVSRKVPRRSRVIGISTTESGDREGTGSGEGNRRSEDFFKVASLCLIERLVGSGRKRFARGRTAF
ncbi:unnamed protein product [Calypogeia fissa]